MPRGAAAGATFVSRSWAAISGVSSISEMARLWPDEQRQRTNLARFSMMGRSFVRTASAIICKTMGAVSVRLSNCQAPDGAHLFEEVRRDKARAAHEHALDQREVHMLRYGGVQRVVETRHRL